MLNDFLKKKESIWTDAKGNYPEVVLSSRVRLARNFNKYKFPLMNDEDDLEKVLEEVADFIAKLDYLSFYRMKDFSDLEKKVLVEKHLISPAHSGETEQKGLVLDPKGALSIMVNEEDHLRIQCFAAGLDLEKVFADANRLDDLLEERIDYAYDERYGYLTTCPTNLGTGLRVSVMLHLPGLLLTKKAGPILKQLSQLGLAVRGLYGEGTESLANLFQISNQNTLGQSEEEIIANLDFIVRKLVSEEKKAQEYLLENHRYELLDRVSRAYGLLRYAKLISLSESVELISDLRLASSLALAEGRPLKNVNELLLMAQPGYLELVSEKKLSPLEMDIKRAEILARNLDNNSEVQ